MNIFERMWKEGWFNPNLDINITIDDIDIPLLKAEKRIVVRKEGRVFTVSIPEDKDFDSIEDHEISITEHPGSLQSFTILPHHSSAQAYPSCASYVLFFRPLNMNQCRWQSALPH